MKFRKDATFLLIAVLVIFIGGVANVVLNNKDLGGSHSGEKKVVKVGAVIPVEASSRSDALKSGIKIAEDGIQEFALRNDLKPPEVLVLDSKLDPKTGKQAARDLIRQGVDALYSSHTVVTQEINGLSKDAKTPLFYDSCNCGFAEENTYAFQIYFDPRKECREIAQDFKDRGASGAGFIGKDVPYGRFCYEEVQKVFGEENVSIELESGVGLKNYSALLRRWLNDGVGVVFSIPEVTDFADLFSRNVSSKVNLPIACFEGVCLTEEIKGETSEEALSNVIGFGFEIEKDFEEKILAENTNFNREDIVAAAVSHDAILHAWYLSAQCGNDVSCMQNLSRSAEYPTAIVSEGFGQDNILIYQSRR